MSKPPRAYNFNCAPQSSQYLYIITCISDYIALNITCTKLYISCVSDYIALNITCIKIVGAHQFQIHFVCSPCSLHEYRLTSWLGQQEDLNRIVLYQADKRMTTWTQRCIRQVSHIISEAHRVFQNVSAKTLMKLIDHWHRYKMSIVVGQEALDSQD